MWYCISILGSVQEYDRQVLMKLLNEPNLRNRIGVVLTKCDEDDSEGSEAKIFKNIIKEDFGFSLPIFEVSTDLTLDLDVENLIEWSASQIDDKDMREAFVASQIVNLKKKRETAAKEIAGFSAAAAAIGAVPIPFSDAALLVPLQLAMSTAIIHSYGMESFATISKSVIGNIGQLDTGLQYSKFDMRGIGGGVGAEYGASDITLGAAYTFQYDKIYNWARDIRATTDGGAAYIKYSPGDFILRGVATMFYTDMHETKNVANLHLDNNSSVYTYGAWSDIGYKISSYDWDITPGAGVQYTLVHRRTSTDDAGQRIDGDNLNFWTAYTNTTFAYNGFDFGEIGFVPSVTLGLAYDMYSDNDIFDITVNNNRYEIVGTKLPHWAGNIGANLNMTFNQYGEISIGINAQMRDNYNNISAMIRAAMRF